jgi:hypothetical protein
MVMASREILQFCIDAVLEMTILVTDPCVTDAKLCKLVDQSFGGRGSCGGHGGDEASP